MSSLKLLFSAIKRTSQSIPAIENTYAAARSFATYPEDIETHTGQKWEPTDYRMARFIERPKHVNENFAIRLIAEVPPKLSKERVVWCDGGSGPEGHPRVYINLDKPGTHDCMYCGLRFVLDTCH